MSALSDTNGPAGTLHTAAAHGDLETIARLVDAGADINGRDGNGMTPLLCAIRQAQPAAAVVAVTRVLLDRGAEVNARGGGMGITPLMAAADAAPAGEEITSSIVALLLARGAEVNARAANGAGALARAVVAGNEKTARLLLDAGAHPNGAGADAPPNTAPLWAAVALKRRGLVKLLIEYGAEINTGDSSAGTPFTVAVSGGDAEIARMLLDAGADPNRPSRVNLPLLAVALRLQNPPMARLLEERGLSLAQAEQVGEEARNETQ